MNSIVIYSLRIASLVLAIIMMGLSYIKSIEFIQYVHLVMILRLICSNCLFRDDFDYISFSSRLQIFKVIMRFCMIVLNIIA